VPDQDKPEPKNLLPKHEFGKTRRNKGEFRLSALDRYIFGRKSYRFGKKIPLFPGKGVKKS
jgi:hypothetical protein